MRPRGKTSPSSASRNARENRSSAGPIAPPASVSPATKDFSSVPKRPRRSRAAMQNAIRSRGRLKRYQKFSKAPASRRGSNPLTNAAGDGPMPARTRSEEHTSELQSLRHLVCRLLLEKKKTQKQQVTHAKI